MLDFSQMVTHLVVALVLGALMGLERELVGKEAGVRTSMMVAAGAALFAILALQLPYIVATSPENLSEVVARNSGFLAVIANIVVGIGFIGAGIIMKTEEHIRGLTTAAVVWAVAAVGALAGVGLLGFATAAAIILSGSLFLLRKLGLLERLDRKN